MDSDSVTYQLKMLLEVYKRRNSGTCMFVNKRTGERCPYPKAHKSHYCDIKNHRAYQLQQARKKQERKEQDQIIKLQKHYKRYIESEHNGLKHNTNENHHVSPIKRNAIDLTHEDMESLSKKYHDLADTIQLDESTTISDMKRFINAFMNDGISKMINDNRHPHHLDAISLVEDVVIVLRLRLGKIRGSIDTITYLREFMEDNLIFERKDK